MYEDLIAEVLEALNADGQTEDEDLLAAAQELAEGVTAERDAEIAGALPVPYTARVPARAQIDGDTLHIPRVAYIQASKVGDGDWKHSARGRKLKRAKKDVAVGVHVELKMEGIQIVSLAVLWRRDA